MFHERTLPRRRIAIVGVPLCDGERESGVEKAPTVIREAGLLAAFSGGDFRDLGDIALETPLHDKILGKARNTDYIVSSCRKVRQVVADVARAGDIPLVIGGDCSLFPGSLAGVIDVHDRVGVLYIDGHADFHTPETTISGYFSGMSLAAAVGRGQEELVRIGKRFPLVREEDVSAFGVKMANFDASELESLSASRVNLFTSELLKRDGILSGLHTATKFLPRPLYLHFDVDVMDVSEMPALAGMRAGVHHQGGLSRSEVSSLCDGLAGLPLAGIDITLYDPNLDPDKTHARTIIEIVKRIFPARLARP